MTLRPRIRLMTSFWSNKTRFGKKKLLSTRLKSRTVQDFTTPVVYDSVGFVKKNADKLYDNLEDLMQELRINWCVRHLVETRKR